nr:MAG TPA: hypothetical protein [Caudoviricetes sp.]
MNTKNRILYIKRVQFLFVLSFCLQDNATSRQLC